jgi:hypothetical protein
MNFSNTLSTENNKFNAGEVQTGQWKYSSVILISNKPYSIVKQ